MDADTTTVGALRAVGDPVRWRIVSLLAREELCTCHLQDELGLKQTLVSHHLRALRDAGVVEASPCGRFTYYRLVPGVVDALADRLAALTADGPAPRRAC
jgi:ArsR family transcriptional regulator, arsenate/arsenite/antimonite-responsive transcriptional repressor